MPVLLIAVAGAAVTANEPWRNFEMLPAHIIASQAAVRLRTTPTAGVTWAAALPSLFGGSSIAKDTQFDLGRQPFAIHLEKQGLPQAIEANPERFAKLGGAVLPVDKSKSADLFHVQRDSKGRHVVIEWQQKFDVRTALQMSTVRDEVQKCNSTLPTIFVIFAATVGPTLLSLIESLENRVLVLPSWSGKKAAEYVLGSDKMLLWRKADSQKWFLFPSTSTVFDGSVADDPTIVSVRPQLEIIIPHHDVVRDLVGESRFDALVMASAAKASVDSTSAMITTLDDVFDSNPKQELKQIDKLPHQQQEQKHDDDPFAAYDDKTKMEDVVRAIADKEEYDEEEIAPTLTILKQQLIKSVRNLRSLSVERIEQLGMPPVVTEYLQRVKKGH